MADNALISGVNLFLIYLFDSVQFTCSGLSYAILDLVAGKRAIRCLQLRNGIEITILHLTIGLPMHEGASKAEVNEQAQDRQSQYVEDDERSAGAF